MSEVSDPGKRPNRNAGTKARKLKAWQGRTKPGDHSRKGLPSSLPPPPGPPRVSRACLPGLHWTSHAVSLIPHLILLLLYYTREISPSLPLGKMLTGLVKYSRVLKGNRPPRHENPKAAAGDVTQAKSPVNPPAGPKRRPEKPT